MSEVNVTLDLKEITVKVKVEGDYSKEEILELAKKQFIKEISNKFPLASYSFSEADTLTFDTVYLGQVVKVVGEDTFGVVTKINKKTIKATARNSSGLITPVQGHPACFKPVKDIDLKSILWKRTQVAKKLNKWSIGDIGYLVDDNNAIHHIVVTNITNAGKYHLYSLNIKRDDYWRLDNVLMTKHVFDSEEEAEKSLK